MDTSNIKRRHSALFIIFFILFINFLVFPKLGFVANADSFWGTHAYDYLKHSLYAWYDMLYGGTYSVSPYIYGYTLATILNFSHVSFSNAGVIAVLMLSTWFVMYKLTVLTLKLRRKKSHIVVLIISTFIVTNEMVRTFLITNITILWGMFFLLLTLYLYFLFFYREKLAYLILSVISLCFSLIDFHSGILAGLFIFCFSLTSSLMLLVQKKGDYLSPIKKLLVFILFAILFNFYWLFNSFYDLAQRIGPFVEYVKNGPAVISTLKTYDSYNRLSANLILTNKNSLTFIQGNVYVFFLDVLTSFFVVFLAYSSLFYIKKERQKLTTVCFVVLMLFFTSLAFGPKNPLGIFTSLWQIVPGSILFRDFFKFHRLLVVLYIILSSYAVIKFLSQNKKLEKLGIFILIIVFLIKIYYLSLFSFIFHPFHIPPYYYSLRTYLSSQKIDNHITIMPIISSHQWYEWPDKPHYDVQDPLRYFSPRPMYINNANFADTNSDLVNKTGVLFLGNNQLKSFHTLLGLRNIHFFIIRGDLVSDFIKGKKSTEASDNEFLNSDILIQNAQNDRLTKQSVSFKKLKIYKTTPQVFLPHFYTSKNYLILHNYKNEFFLALDDFTAEETPALFFQDQNREKLNILKRSARPVNLPTIEFKKINPSKYRVIIHRASSTFPLIFSESFHEKWKIYLIPLKHRAPYLTRIGLVSYKIFDDNSDDQATKQEVENYIQNGFLSTLGDLRVKSISHYAFYGNEEKVISAEKYQIDFISKNMKGTIQNDNLPDGSVFETLNTQPLPETRHLEANGFANSWIIDPSKICSSFKKCSKNADGTYDLQLIVEFWPQRLFIIGLTISLIALIMSILYIAFYYAR